MKSEENVSTTKIAFWYVISNFLTVAIGNLTTPIFARLMSVNDYGKFSNFLTWQNLLLILFSLSLVTTIGKAKYDYSETIEEYLSTMVLFGNLIGIVFWIFIEINAKYFIAIFNMDMKYIRIMLIDILFIPAFSLLQSFFQMYKKYKFFVFFSISSAIVRTVGSIVLIILMEDNFNARVMGYTVPNIIMNIFLWIYIVYKGRKFRIEYCKYALPIALPMVVNSIAGNILSTSDRIMITEFCGEGDTAMYTMAYSCTTVASVLWTAMNQAWIPWLYDRLYCEEYEIVRRKARGYIGIYFILVVVIMLILPEILWIFGGDKYVQVQTIIPVIFISIFCQFIYGLYINVETYMKKTYYSMLGTGMAAGVNIVLNYIAIPRWGYEAAAYTTFIGYLLLAIFHTCIVGVNKTYKTMYDAKFNFVLLFLLILYCFLCNYIYSYQVIRYILVLSCFIVVIILGFYYKMRNKEV